MHTYRLFAVPVLVLAVFLGGCSLFGGSNDKNFEKSAGSMKDTLLPDIQTQTPILTNINMTQEKVNFKTNDGVQIVGNWNNVEGAKKAVLLMHMMPATKESYSQLATYLNRAGFSTLAIDLRGHGESTQKGDQKLDYNKFSDVEQQAKRLDVDASLNFLKGKGFTKDIAIVGASIGANLAADAMNRYGEINRAVLLSPGIDYRGVKTEPAIKQLTKGQQVWGVSSEGDTYSNETVVALQQLKPDNFTLTVVEGKDHGTDLFNSQKTLTQDIVNFLAS